MALQILASSSGTLEVSLEAWKKAQVIGDVTLLHEIAAKRLKVYLADKAAAALERVTNPADHAAPPSSTELVPVSRQRGPRAPRPKMTPTDFAEAGIRMAHWDFTEYLWSLENLTDDLAPAFARSRRLFAACVAVKGLQLCFWPSFEYASGITMLAGYHAGFALLYLSSLRLVAHCRRRVGEFRTKIRNTREMDEEDVRDWNAFVFKAANWMADMRAWRQRLFPTRRIGLAWIVDLFIVLTHS